MPPDKIFKICLIGPVEVGKTSIIKKYSQDQKDFLQANHNNSQVSNPLMRLYEIDNKEVLLNIWDFPSEFDNKQKIPLYIRDTNGIILIFDLSNKKSVKKLENWVKTLNSIGYQLNTTALSLVLAGNKNDVDPAMKDQDVEKLTNKIKKILHYEDPIPFFKVSAETNENIQEMFDAMLQLLLNQKKR